MIATVALLCSASAPVPAPAAVAAPAAGASVGAAAAVARPDGPVPAASPPAAGRAERADPPLAGPLTVLVPFDPPDRPYGSGHRGVDLAADHGQEVRAAVDGVVVYAGMLAGRGVVSIERADGVRVSYEPVAAAVARGVTVRAGDRVGTVSGMHPPCAPDTCLHWGVRTPDGTYLDPMGLLRPPVIALLPWSAGE